MNAAPGENISKALDESTWIMDANPNASNCNHQPAADAGADSSTVFARRFRQRWNRHRDMLAMATVVIVLSCVLKIRTDQKVAVTGFLSLPMPELCLSKSLWGLKCPGCGLTRSFIHLAHGRFHESISLNRIGWVLALATVLQIPYRIWGLWYLSKHKTTEPIPAWLPMAFAWCLILVLVGNWLYLVAFESPFSR